MLPENYIEVANKVVEGILQECLLLIKCNPIEHHRYVILLHSIAQNRFEREVLTSDERNAIQDMQQLFRPSPTQAQQEQAVKMMQNPEFIKEQRELAKKIIEEQ